MFKPAIIGLLVAGATLPGGLPAQTGATRALQQWTVEPTATVLIGAASGEPEYLFASLRAAIRLQDGRIVALDALRDFAVLRYYGPRGEFLKSVGRWGDGPFEFKFPFGLYKLGGDSVYVLSSDLRFSIFGPQGEGASSGRLELNEPPVPSPSFLLSRSHLVVHVPSRGSSGPIETGIRRPTVRYVSWDLDAKKETLIVEVPGVKNYYERQGNGVRIYPAPFSPMVVAAVSRGLLWVAQSDEPTLRGYDGGGQLRAEIPLPLLAKRIGPDDRSRFRSRLLDMGERVQGYAAYSRSVTFPDVFPILGNLKTDSEGNFWVQDYETPWATGDQVWHVLDRTGAPIAVVALPEKVVGRCTELDPRACDRIFEIGADYVLIHRKDDLGVSQIAMHRLRKAG